MRDDSDVPCSDDLLHVLFGDLVACYADEIYKRVSVIANFFDYPLAVQLMRQALHP